MKNSKTKLTGNIEKVFTRAENYLLKDRRLSYEVPTT
jgi:hypothetical protein